MHHIGFIPDEGERYLRLEALLGPPHVVEGLAVRDGVHQEQAVGPLRDLVAWQLLYALQQIGPRYI